MSLSSELRIADKYNEPLLTPKIEEPKKERNWTKILAIVAVVVGGIIAALAGLCIYGVLPLELLGGELGVGITLIVGASILIPAAYILWKNW